MLNVILGIVGLVIGGALFDIQGAAAGFLIGILFGEITGLKNRIKQLEKTSQPSEKTAFPVSEKDTREQEAAMASPEALGADETVPIAGTGEDIAQPQPIQMEAEAISHEGPAESRMIHDEPSNAPGKTNFAEEAVRYIIHFFTTGNVVAKTGVIILFFGVAFLLKFVAQRNFFPLEARLAGVAIGAIALIATGWKIRINRLTYGLILQGGGIGILYLNLFAAAKHYELMPITLAFGIMVCLVVLSVTLAVLQDSRALAGFGAIGGFLAPVLMSTGSGNHLALFSYYSLLNAGILGVAWFKAWREINLIGFVFTFVIGALWGAEYYQPSYFMSVEPFLVLSFIFYVAISVLFAFRQPFHLKGYVDTTLVFGTPLVVFALQHGLVRNFEYGLAISAFAMSAVYILLATSLWKRNIEGMRLLTESFLALGVVFGSLGIPLALEGRWTTASWSLEGAALVWVGIRQKRLLARNFGLLLIIGANISFFMSSNEPSATTPILNGFYLSCFMISMASLFISYLLYTSEKELEPWERGFHLIMLTAGLIWWYASGIHELDRLLLTKDLYNSIIIGVALSCIVTSLLALRLEWQAMQMASIGLLPAMALAVLISYFDVHGYHPFYRLGILSWGIAFAAQYFLLARHENIWPAAVVSWWHKCSLWLVTLVLTLESSWWAGKLINGAWTWEFVCLGIVPAAAIVLLLRKGKKLQWPIRRFEPEYLGQGVGILNLYLILWSMSSCLLPGNAAPLSYIPIANPLDLAQLFVLFVIVLWAWYIYKDRLPLGFFLHYKILLYIPACIFFIWLNAMIARSVHHFGGIPYTTNSLFHSIIFHAAISISWSLAALLVTFWATRKGFREAWFAGAALLSLVVLKLFLVDLASSGTVARIVSFLVVGFLMLLIGYLSPLPAFAKNEATE